MRNVMMMLAAAAALVSIAPAAQAQSLFGGLEGDELAAAITKAEQSPLGSKENPVRVDMPRGEYRYLGRLKCTDGKTPKFERAGNVGVGVFGNIIDLYEVVCSGEKPREIYMDMYFHDEEKRPVPGFTFAE